MRCRDAIEGGDQRRHVLARLEGAEEENVRVPRTRGGQRRRVAVVRVRAEAVVVDAVGDDVHRRVRTEMGP